MRFTGVDGASAGDAVEADDRSWPESVTDAARYKLVTFTMKLCLWTIAEASPCPELDGIRSEAAKIRDMLAASPFAMTDDGFMAVSAALDSTEKLREIELINNCFAEAEAAHKRGNALRSAAGMTC